MQLLKIEQQQDIGLARRGKMARKKRKTRKRRNSRVNGVTIPSQLCKAFISKIKQDLKVAGQVNGQQEKLKCSLGSIKQR